MRTNSYPRTNNPTRVLEQAILASALGLMLFFTLALGVFLGAQVLSAGRIYPGVSVAGIKVGGLSISAAADKIANQQTYPLTGRLAFQDGASAWLAKPVEVGLFLDTQSSAKAAYQIGRTGGLYQRISEQMGARVDGRDVAAVLILDERMAHAYLTGLASGINKVTVEASLNLKGTDVLVQPGQIGRQVDIPATLSLLEAQLHLLRDGVVPLVIQEEPPTIVDLSAQAELVRQILSAPLNLKTPSGQPDSQGPWVFSPSALAGMLRFEKVKTDQGLSFQVTLNSDLMRSFLTDLAPKLAKDPQNTRFSFNDATRKLDVIQSAVVGRNLDIEASLKTIQDEVTQGKHSIDLTLKLIDPQVTDAKTGEQLGIRELIHTETSYFYGSSPERVQNIKASASRFHGLLVAPGEVFSMSNALGDISLDNGYAEALIILGDQTIKGVGGGVCQVSTTLFRTVFFAGLPIIERHAHAYRVSYYEKVAGNHINPDFAGLDATVFVPLVDFKFKNDSPNWLLMETYVNPSSSSIMWKFYSTSDGRKVDWTTTGPTNLVKPPDPIYRENPDLAKDEFKQVDWPAVGSDITVTRTVTRASDTLLRDTFNTHYLAWAAAYEYGPGTNLPPAGQTP